MLIWVESMLKRCVFSFFFKMSRFSESLMDFGSWFHNVGAEYLKDCGAKVWYLTFGMCSRLPVLLECMLSHVFFFMLIRSCKYFGAMSVMHHVRILYSIHCCMGSKCTFFSAHVELKYLFLFRTSLAQMFCMIWYFLRVVDGRP